MGEVLYWVLLGNDIVQKELEVLLENAVAVDGVDWGMKARKRV